MRVEGVATSDVIVMAKLSPVPFGRCRGRWRGHQRPPVLSSRERRGSGFLFRTFLSLPEMEVALSFSCTALQIGTLVTAVTVARNGYICGSHALYVCQVCLATCLTHTESTEWRLVNMFCSRFQRSEPLSVDGLDGVRGIV